MRVDGCWRIFWLSMRARKMSGSGHSIGRSGALAPGRERALDFGVITSAKVQPQELEQVVAFERKELDRLQRLYRGDRRVPTCGDAG